MPPGIPLAATVLLVDPSADARAIYSRYLRARGLTVLEADSSDMAAAVATVADVIVTEMHVPGSLSGLELVRQWRQARGRECRAVVLTTAAWSSDRKAAQEAGCDVFLTKPCEPEKLFMAVTRLVGRSRERRMTGGFTSPSTS